jgi:hypothetical protein
VGGLLEKAALTTQILDNALSLQLTMPNIRRHGVVETRAPDSPDTPEALKAVVKVYNRFAYDSVARRALVDDFSGIESEKLKAAFLGRFEDKNIASAEIGGGKTVADLIHAVEGGKNATVPSASPSVSSRPRFQ